MLPNLAQLQPYFSAIGALLGIATLGFVIALAKSMAEAAKLRHEALEERIRLSREQLDWTRERTAAEKNDLEGEVESLRGLLAAAQVSTTTLTARSAKDAIAGDRRAMISDTASALQHQLEIADGQLSSGASVDSRVHLELGKAFMALEAWPVAARSLEQFNRLTKADWSEHLLRGIAHANTNAGRESDRVALGAYNDAVGSLPDDYGATVSHQLLARLFTYRAAIFKRLGRLAEAEADLGVARGFASGDFEMAYLLYNLACIHAMQGRRGSMMEALTSLKRCAGSFDVVPAIRAHLKDYFWAYIGDGEFMELLASMTPRPDSSEVAYRPYPEPETPPHRTISFDRP